MFNRAVAVNRLKIWILTFKHDKYLWNKLSHGGRLSFIDPKVFYEQFRDDAEAAKQRAYHLGREMGQSLFEKQGIRERNLNALAAILNEFQRMVQGEPNARVEGKTIVMQCRGFCPIMRAALTLNIPWQWLDEYYVLPMFRGMSSLVDPDLKVNLLFAKSRGDPQCLYHFEA